MAVHSWGGNASGALGTGSHKDELLPVVAEGALRGKHVVGVSCGELHSLAVDDLGNAYGWGRNREGQAGVGFNSPTVTAPMRIVALAHEKIVKVIAGSHQSFGITADGRLYRWGLFHAKRPDLAGTPAFFGLTDLGALNDVGRSMIERSQYLYFSNRASEEAVDDAQQAEVSTVGTFRRVRISTPELVPLPSECGPVVDAAIGYCFYLIATADGTLHVFGFNDKGQLGLGDRFTRELPVPVPGLAGHKIVGVAAGQQHSAAVSDTGRLFTWGGGTFGIGHGDGADVLQPRQVQALEMVDVAALAAGAHHTFCLTRDGRVFSFGHGEYGQQGTGDFGSAGERTRNALVPREFFLPSESPWLQRFQGLALPSVATTAGRVRSVACGHLHTLFRTDDGAVWSCGWGVDGVLGHGDKKYRAVPAPIRALEGEVIAAAAAGWRHNLIIKANSSTFALDFQQLLATSLLSDVTFVVEGKPVRAHRVMVAARCPRLAALLAFHRRFCLPSFTDATAWIVPVPGVRFVAFQAFLGYLYTDHLRIARFFVPDVRVIARLFRMARLEALCQQQMDGEHATIVVPPSTFAADLGDRVGSATDADVVFGIPEPALEGHDEPPGTYAYIPVHKALLLARSEYFRSLLSPLSGFHDARDAVIRLDGCPFEPETFRAVLLHLYTGRRDVVASDAAIDLLSAAHYLMLDDLKQIAEDAIERTVLADIPATDVETWQSYADAASSLQAVRLAARCAAVLATA